ncbi:putative ATP-dependent RNA helicase DDX60 [Microcaecilia unicolor]|uniref:Probable ATP-dependent RNA helicase DDX60 n=1 Tax=Microcaecilia unicolor TaxID=1415580 RepID=A0A6P7WXW2_9AMPH|nr:probable ATP-dependent RNA helicase DDX60 [Microcaecilia unicolor]
MASGVLDSWEDYICTDSEDEESKISLKSSENETLLVGDQEEETNKTLSEFSSLPDEGDLQSNLEADYEISETWKDSPEFQNPESSACCTFEDTLSDYIVNEFAKAEYSSLLNDYVESEFFLIDGDSLLITHILQKTLRKGQTLHFFYLVECFLSDLTEKGAKYILVFFKDAEYFYYSQPHLLSLRTALIFHLERNTDLEVHTVFTNCLSQKWQEFLKERHPYFLIIADEGLNDFQTLFLNIFIFHALGMKISVALISGQTSDVLRVYGYLIQSRHKHIKDFQQDKKKVKHAMQTLIQDQKKCNFLPGQLSLINVQKEATSHQTVEKDVGAMGGWRRFRPKRKVQRPKEPEPKSPAEGMDKAEWDTMIQVHQVITQLKQLWPEGSDIRRILCVVTCSLGLKMHSKVAEYSEASESSTQGHLKCGIHQENSEPLTLQEVADLCRMHCLSIIFLSFLPLSQRGRSKIIGSCWDKRVCTFLKMQQVYIYLALKILNNDADWTVDLTYLPDFSDNILWKNIAHYHETEAFLGLDLGKIIEREYQDLWNTISKLTSSCDIGEPFPLRCTSKPFLIKEQIPLEVPEKKIPNTGLIPINSDLVEDYAGDVLKDLLFLSRDHSAITSVVQQKEYDELLHWHSGKPLSDDYDRTKGDFDGKSNDPSILRQKQKLQSFQRFYGQTLEGSISKTIVTQSEVPVKKSKSSSKKKAEMIEDNLKSQKAKEDETQLKRWNALSESIKKEIKQNFMSGINRLDDFIKTCHSNSVKFDAEVVGLDTCFELWVEHCKSQDKKSRNTDIAVQVMVRIHILWETFCDQLKKSDLEKIAKCLKYFGFENLALSVDSAQITESDREKFSNYGLDVGAARFQLQYMGHYLLRDERNDPDPRVQHFIPDTWQRELLDAVDNNESAVIVAPTSSGKTYASYYCMEKILRESNEGIVVYVAPTKALVNQVVATVYNRFNKILPDGLSLCGVFTRDYRHDALNSQILVTVPQCLEILLLAPHRQQWVKRIKYVIFDEVHCLGGEIGAEVWEHLLVMIRCPFLALSATISNPERLREWLQSVKRYWESVDNTTVSNDCIVANRKSARNPKEQTSKKYSYTVRLVTYGERYNDLEKYVCSLKSDDFVFEHYHPYAALTVNHIEKYGIPKDLTCSPRETIKLYDSMLAIWPAWPRAEELEPEEFSCFKNKIIIMKSDARKYEEELKKELTNWISCGHRKKADRLLQYLKPDHAGCYEVDMQKKIPVFVEKLKEMNKLPALLFIFNLDAVERIPEDIVSFLTEKQKSKQKPNIKKEKRHLTNKLQKVEKSLESSPSSKGKVSASKTEHNIFRASEKEELQRRLKKCNELPPDCTYANYKSVNDMVLQKILNPLQWARKGETIRGLVMSGVGYHHGSLDQKGRRVVEMLFRMGYIRVVTATSSLALGINMPCKSVVFIEDSVYLDALNYRQMSGRAGRRGQDIIGNVFFYDIPLPKVEKLIKANVPELKGQFPLSITLVLRLMLLAAKADDKEDAKAKVLSVLKHSLISLKRPKTEEMLKLYFLFSCQFLIQESYLNQEGIPVGFAGLVSHLHYHEPGNFVLVRFLMKGLFRKLCQPIKTDSKIFSESVMETLVLILANIFGTYYYPARFCEKKKSFKFFQSKVFLEDLPKDFAVAVNEYNNKIKDIFGCFFLSVSKLANMEEEFKLPLSRTDFAGEECDDSELVGYLFSCNKRRTAVSPFACLSGIVDDDLLDTHTINSAVLQTVDVNTNNIPLLHLKKYDNQGRRMILNSYALDFYKHGSLMGLTQDNGMNEGDAYYRLKDFMLLIKTVSVSLLELCEDENDNVVLAFQQLSNSYAEKLNKY